MKVTIITAVYNREGTIKEALESLNRQDYPNIEHIIIDGASTDNTLKLINTFKSPDAIVYSEPDNGAFDALNKGLEMASGDIVGFLHSDDFFAHDQVISDVVNEMNNNKVDAVFGDVLFVSPNDLKKEIRYYSSKEFTLKRFESGYMPAHPTFFTKREFYQRFGGFNTRYKIAADFELLLRFLYVHKISYHYMGQLMIYMRTGGLSNATIKSRFILNKEIFAACKQHGVKTSVFKIISKVIRKIPEYFSGRTKREISKKSSSASSLLS